MRIPLAREKEQRIKERLSQISYKQKSKHRCAKTPHYRRLLCSLLCHSNVKQMCLEFEMRAHSVLIMGIKLNYSFFFVLFFCYYCRCPVERFVFRQFRISLL